MKMRHYTKNLIRGCVFLAMFGCLNLFMLSQPRDPDITPSGGIQTDKDFIVDPLYGSIGDKNLQCPDNIPDVGVIELKQENQGITSSIPSNTDPSLQDINLDYTQGLLICLVSLSTAILAIGKYHDWFNNTKSHPVRECILSLIELNPGIHCREISRSMQKSIGVIQYHLKYMAEIDQSIVSIEDGSYLRFFTRDYLPNQEIPAFILLTLKHPTANQILNRIYQSQSPVSRITLATDLGLTRQAISWQCQKLVKLNFISESIVMRERTYSIRPEMLPLLAAFFA